MSSGIGHDAAPECAVDTTPGGKQANTSANRGKNPPSAVLRRQSMAILRLGAG